MTVGNCLQLSTGSGWDVLQWKGWARPVPRLRGCPRPCGGGSGLVHAWNGPQGAAVAWLCWRGARGEGLRGGFVSLLVPKGALASAVSSCARKKKRKAHLCKLRLRAVRSKPCFRFAQTACSLPPFTAVTGWPLSYTWLRHVSDKGRLPIRRFASHGLAHPARHTPAPARAGKAPGETPAGAFRRMPKG